MFDESLLVMSKIVAMCIFFPVYLGFVVYAFWRPNREKFDQYSQIPFQDD